MGYDNRVGNTSKFPSRHPLATPLTAQHLKVSVTILRNQKAFSFAKKFGQINWHKSRKWPTRQRERETEAKDWEKPFNIALKYTHEICMKSLQVEWIDGWTEKEHEGTRMKAACHCNCQLSFRFGGCQTSCQIKNAWRAQVEWQLAVHSGVPEGSTVGRQRFWLACAQKTDVCECVWGECRWVFHLMCHRFGN